MGIVVMVLPVEEETAATLRIQVPKQYTQTTLGQEAGKVDGSSGLSNASFDIVYGNFFHEVNLMTKP